MIEQCDARRHGDQVICHRCGLVWNINDNDPPDCDPYRLRTVNPQPKPKSKALDAALATIRRIGFGMDVEVLTFLAALAGVVFMATGIGTGSLYIEVLGLICMCIAMVLLWRW